MRKRERTWIVVADGARARFFSPAEDGKTLVPARTADLVSPESRRRASDLVSDKPGRSFSSARGGPRHSFEATHDVHKLEKHKFSAALAELLDDACQRKEFDQLILVAPHRSLGELRGLLSARVQRSIRKEIARDLTGVTPATLWRHLRPAVSPGL
jgi:protein required for attachment to host cells